MYIRVGCRPSPFAETSALLLRQVAFLGFIFQHAAYPGKGPIQNLVVRIWLIVLSFAETALVPYRSAPCSELPSSDH